MIEGGQSAGGLTSEHRERYSRQLALPGFGGEAQLALRDSRVLVVGAGGLGSAVIPALAAAGVGTIGVVDDDRVELSNLHRQLAHSVADIGRLKVDSMAQTVAAIDPSVSVVAHREVFDAQNADRMLRDYDLLIDGSDNFATRYLCCDAAVRASVPLVWGAVLRYDGQVGVSWPTGPTYRDLFPSEPDAAATMDCEVGGVFPAVCAVIGGVVAAEAVKLITGIGTPLLGRMLSYDARSARVREVVFGASLDARPRPPEAERWRRTRPDDSAGADAVPAITARALLSALDDEHPPVVVDVRTAFERERRPLADALTIPMDDLEPGSAALPQRAAQLRAGLSAGEATPTAGSTTVVIVCAAGVRSHRAALALASAGVPGVLSLQGGVAALDGALATREAQP